MIINSKYKHLYKNMARELGGKKLLCFNYHTSGTQHEPIH